MGVTLYYSGRLKSVDLLPEFKFEMQDIADTMNWPCDVIDQSWDEPVDVSLGRGERGVEFRGNAGLKGVIINPHERSESLWLLFDNAGQLQTFFTKMEELEGDDSEPTAFTKTQFAGVDTHIRLVKIMRYVGAKYMTDFSLEDDCGYCEHSDRAKAQQVFGVIDRAIDQISEVFSSMKMSEKAQSDPEFLFQEIETKIRAYMGDGVSVHMVRAEEEEE